MPRATNNKIVYKRKHLVDNSRKQECSADSKGGDKSVIPTRPAISYNDPTEGELFFRGKITMPCMHTQCQRILAVGIQESEITNNARI